MKLRLQNISNLGSTIYLFCREKDGSLKVTEDKKFFPYYFEPTTDKVSDAVSIYGEPLKKIYCNHPKEVRKQRSINSYSADLVYTYRYIIDKVDEILPSIPRIVFFDIEVQAPELPRPKETQTAPYPISTIVMYDSYIKKYRTSYIKDYKSEFDMIEDFCNQIYQLKPDILTGWNAVDFDYLYLFYRYDDFPKKISPIRQSHWRNGYEMPAGISIVDMTGLDVKLTLNKRDSYKLNNVANEDLGYELWEQEDFMNIELSKKKCQEDVKKLVQLNDKNKYFEVFDNIRRFAKVTWEDLPAEYKNYSWQSLNSRPWDILFFQIAKKLTQVLPNKPNYTDEERHEYSSNVYYKKDGAYRETFQTGIFFDVIKCDLGSAYPRMIIDFCLDKTNLHLQHQMPDWFPEEIEIANLIKQGYKIWSKTKWGLYLIENNFIPVPVYFRETEEQLRKRKEYKNNFPEDWKSLRWICYYKQNPNTVLPQAFKAPMVWKQELKDELKKLSEDTEEGKSASRNYKSCKSFGNSGFGISGNLFTRLFDLYIFNTTTGLPRDLLEFLEAKLNKLGIKIILIDTDSFVLNTSDISIVKKLNQWIIEWAMGRYGNENVDIELELEGIFIKIYVGSKCRYIGQLQKPNGEIETEKKGLQLVRRDYEKFVKDFQTELIKEKLWEKTSKEDVIDWIKEKIIELKQAPLQDIAFPCKINKPREEYAKKEIYFLALDETQKLIPKFEKKIGEKYWWIYTKEPRVLAFDLDNQKHIKRENIDWNAVIERCIFNILVPIFSSLNWETDLLDLAESYGIVLGSQYRNKLLADLPNFEELKKKYSAREAKKRINPQPSVSKQVKKKRGSKKKAKKVDK
ncbi:MAG: DNA polymerase domain-containing protein [Candidatus Thorarchaeota archaeon]|jgi:DNA polymerase elongation subunit (family B)